MASVTEHLREIEAGDLHEWSDSCLSTILAQFDQELRENSSDPDTTQQWIDRVYACSYTIRQEQQRRQSTHRVGAANS